MDTAIPRGERNRQGHGQDAKWNLHAPVLQESADSMISGWGWNQLAAMYENNAATGQKGTALEDAQKLTAYQVTPEAMRQGERLRLAGMDGKTRFPMWVWGIGAVALFLVVTRK